MASFGFSLDLGDAKVQLHRLLSQPALRSSRFIRVARNEGEELSTGGAFPTTQPPSLLGTGGCCPAWLNALASLAHALHEAETSAYPKGGNADLGLWSPHKAPGLQPSRQVLRGVPTAEGGQTTFLPPSFPPHPTPW